MKHIERKINLKLVKRAAILNRKLIFVLIEHKKLLLFLV